MADGTSVQTRVVTENQTGRLKITILPYISTFSPTRRRIFKIFSWMLFPSMLLQYVDHIFGHNLSPVFFLSLFALVYSLLSISKTSIELTPSTFTVVTTISNTALLRRDAKTQNLHNVRVCPWDGRGCVKPGMADYISMSEGELEHKFGRGLSLPELEMMAQEIEGFLNNLKAENVPLVKLV